MTLTKSARKKRKDMKVKDILGNINEFLDYVMKEGRTGSAKVHISPETMEQYEELALENRRKIRATPRPAKDEDVLGELVFKKVPATEKKEHITPPMTRDGLHAALDLAEAIELAGEGKRLTIKKWAEG